MKYIFKDPIMQTTTVNDGYYCDLCDYIARDAYNMRKHLNTGKHIQICNVAGRPPATTPTPEPKPYQCEQCMATYEYRQSLWRHKKKAHP